MAASMNQVLLSRPPLLAAGTVHRRTVPSAYPAASSLAVGTECHPGHGRGGGPGADGRREQGDGDDGQRDNCRQAARCARTVNHGDHPMTSLPTAARLVTERDVPGT